MSKNTRSIGTPQHLGLGAIDVGVDLRRARVEQRERLGETVVSALAAPAMPPIACSSAGRPRPARSCTYSLKPPPVPMPGTDGGGSTRTKASSQCLHLLAQIVENAWRGQAYVHPLLERLQWHEDHAGVRCVGEGCAIEAGECHRVLRRLVATG